MTALIQARLNYHLENEIRYLSYNLYSHTTSFLESLNILYYFNRYHDSNGQPLTNSTLQQKLEFVYALLHIHDDEGTPPRVRAADIAARLMHIECGHYAQLGGSRCRLLPVALQNMETELALIYHGARFHNRFLRLTSTHLDELISYASNF